MKSSFGGLGERERIREEREGRVGSDFCFEKISDKYR